MKMERNCDLELRLLSSSFDDSDLISSMEESNSSEKEESQRMTIFYNGKMYCVSHVTHLQAKAIISLARSGMGETSSSSSSSVSNPNTTRQTTCMALHQGSDSVASMKKSLQRFLQKRRDRIHATCPYHHS